MCEKKVFERFNQYDWNKDKEFESGYQAIMNTIQVEDENMRLLKAKHFYFSKFQQPFDLDTYLKYEQEKQESFEAVDSYDYENDSLFMDGLSHIIQSWLEKQSEGLWEKDRLELELKKAKALYYHTVDQVNSVRFAVTKKQKHKGAFEITLSSPTTKNIISIDRLHELQEAYQEGNQEDVTCLFLKTTVHDTFQTAETIQTRDTKILSSGLAYQETSHMTSDEQSMYELSKAYYDLVKQELLKPPKPIVSFSNGQIPLDASYLFLVPTSFRLITEHAMMDFKLELSHAPIPPLSLFKICRLSIEFKVYLALAPTKLRGPELLFLGLADVFDQIDCLSGRIK
ncbi:hypothetical protein G6F56_008762 [Rhizopus delemar]|nr:hypothetical protein G6F56_008762 [Rhizopus delemar]